MGSREEAGGRPGPRALLTSSPGGGIWPESRDLGKETSWASRVLETPYPFQRTLEKQHTCLSLFPKVGVSFLQREHEGRNKPGTRLP